MTVLLTDVCVACGTTFDYEWGGKRRRKLCDDPGCRKRRNTRNQAAKRARGQERPCGYRPDDYPISVQTEKLPPDDLADIVALTTELYQSRKRRVSTDIHPDQSADYNPDDEQHDPDEITATSYKDLIESGSGYVMDDTRLGDDFPLRYIPHDRKAEVRAWCSQNGFPLAGYAGTTARRNDARTYVLGAMDTPGLTPRITRRFCSQNALTPLEPFVWQ